MHNKNFENTIKNNTKESYQNTLVPLDYKPRIEDLPSKNLKVACIIPLYHEYANGNVQQIIKSAINQTQSPDNFELIFVVNNREEDYREKNEVYTDNLQAIEYIAELADTQKIKIHSIDLTQGVDKNMGLIRNTGIIEAVHRFLSKTDAKQNGIIAWLDCDSRINRGYIHALIEEFEKNKIEAAITAENFIINEGESEHFKSSYMSQFMLEKWAFMDTLCPEHSEMTGIGGPRLVVSVSGLEKIGGIDETTGSNEDFELGRKITEQTNFSYMPKSITHVVDRARESGFDSNYRSMSNYEGISEITESEPRYTLLIETISRIYELDESIIHDYNTLEKIHECLLLTWNEKKFKDIIEKHSNLQKDTSSEDKVWLAHKNNFDIFQALGEYTTERLHNISLNEYIDSVNRIIEANTTEDEMAILRNFEYTNTKRESILFVETNIYLRKLLNTMEELSRNYAGEDILADSLYSIKEKKEFEKLFEKNTWVGEKIKTLWAQYKNPEKIYESLAKDFPDYIGEKDNAPHRFAAVNMRAINDFILLVQSKPSEFPQMQNFINLLKGN